MSLDWIESAAALEALQPEWEELYERSDSTTPFQHPDWILPWWEIFGSGQVFSLAMRRQGRLIALAPMFLHVWRGRRQVTLIGNGVSDRLGILADGETQESDAREFVAALSARSSEWDICDFQDLAPDSFLIAAIQRESAAGCLSGNFAHHGRGSSFVRQSEVRAPHCALCGEVLPGESHARISLPRSADQFRSSLPHGLRRNLRRYAEKFRAAGQARWKGAQTEHEFCTFLDSLFRLHGSRWMSRGESGMMAGPVEEFHRQSAVRLWRRGKSRCYVLCLDGRDIAVIYGFLDKFRFWSYQSGFDPGASDFSPGALLLNFVVQEAIREEAREFDFLRGEEAYKSQWGAVLTQSCHAIIWQGQKPVQISQRG